MQMTPVAVVADAYILGFRHVVDVFLHRHGKRLRPLCRGDDTTVAVGLLDEMVVFALCNNGHSG